MGRNTNLHKAKNSKNDEFYTRLEDIEKELEYYKEHFLGSKVYKTAQEVGEKVCQNQVCHMYRPNFGTKES